jgi:DNA-binding transcriptional ArsR family regulator
MSMDAVFKALADPVRRQLLDRLRDRGGQTLGELSNGLGITRQGVSKHLAVLEAANLVVARKQGRERLHHLNPVPIQQLADRWIGKYQRSALQALTDLKQRLEGDDDD